MSQPHTSDRLTPEDAIFLYLEKKEMPLHIGSVSVFEGSLPFEQFVDYAESKLPLIPRYRQRLIAPPFNLGHPVWEPDPDFDIHRHIFQAHLKRGTDVELQGLAGHVFSGLMDRNKPLWDLYLVDGLKGGRSALITRVHHCLVDGVSGVGIMTVLLDSSPKAPPPPSKNTHAYRAPALPNAGALVADALLNSYSEALDRILQVETAALNVAQALVSDQALRSVEKLARLVPELLMPVERLPFNRPCSGQRKIVWTETSIPDIDAIRAACGGTLNDVALTVLTGAVRHYAELHGERVKNRLLRLMVPVSLRRDSLHNGFGNRVSLLPVNVPLDIRDPVRLLSAVRQRTETLKGAHVADVISLVATLVGVTPAPLQALMGPLANLLPGPPFNMVCTNVPGPQAPLYALGHEMLTYYPHVPIGNDMGVGCANLSYNHKLYFGLTADVAAAPDVARLNEFIDQSFGELRKAAGVAPARTRKPRKPVVKAAPAVTPEPVVTVDTTPPPAEPSPAPEIEEAVSMEEDLVPV